MGPPDLMTLGMNLTLDLGTQGQSLWVSLYSSGPQFPRLWMEGLELSCLPHHDGSSP